MGQERNRNHGAQEQHFVSEGSENSYAVPFHQSTGQDIAVIDFQRQFTYRGERRQCPVHIPPSPTREQYISRISKPAGLPPQRKLIQALPRLRYIVDR